MRKKGQKDLVLTSVFMEDARNGEKGMVCAVSSTVLPGGKLRVRQGASRAAPRKSGLHGRGVGERLIALESW